MGCTPSASYILWELNFYFRVYTVYIYLAFSKIRTWHLILGIQDSGLYIYVKLSKIAAWNAKQAGR